MSALALSDRQFDLYAASVPIILAVGAVRSGKTHAGALGFTDYLLTTPPAKHLVSGRSPTELKAEVRPHIMDQARSHGCYVSWNNSERTLTIDGHVLYFIAWSNTQSAERIRGMTFRTALVDEVTLIGEDFFDMMISRLSMPGSRFYGLTNPDAPGHWLKVRIDANRIDKVIQFRLEKDNPSLWNAEGQAYIERLKRMYAPGSVFYKRFILGQWAAATGLIYRQMKAAALPPRGRVTSTFAGLDFGMTNPTSVVRIEERTHVGEKRYWITHSEEIHSSIEVSVMPSAQAKRIATFYEQHPFEVMYADPSASALTSELRGQGGLGCAIVNANNAVADGIAAVERLLAPGTMTIHDHETTLPLRNELAGYVWDDKKQDEPKKQNDHHADALRYAILSHLGRMPLIF